jgi:hypothetical protein
MVDLTGVPLMLDPIAADMLKNVKGLRDVSPGIPKPAVCVTRKRTCECKHVERLSEALDLPRGDLMFGCMKQVVDKREKGRLSTKQTAACAPAFPGYRIYDGSDCIATCLKILLSRSTSSFLRSKSSSNFVPRSDTANRQRMTKSVSSSKEFPSLIWRRNSGRLSADSRQIQLDHAKDQVRPRQWSPLAVDSYKYLKNIRLGFPLGIVVRQILVDDRYFQNGRVHRQGIMKSRNVLAQSPLVIFAELGDLLDSSSQRVAPSHPRAEQVGDL